MIRAIERWLEPDTAGDPMSGLKWTRRTTAKIAAQLLRLRIRVSARTVAHPLWAPAVLKRRSPVVES